MDQRKRWDMRTCNSAVSQQVLDSGGHPGLVDQVQVAEPSPRVSELVVGEGALLRICVGS